MTHPQNANPGTPKKRPHTPPKGKVRTPRASVELTAERAAPGGDCVAHLPDGRVAFVRGALPGERVRAAIIEQTTRFVRADVVEVLEASLNRIEPVCPLAVPGRCGGCDWQHTPLDVARRLKADVVREQLTRLGGLVDPEVTVEPASARDTGLGWRTRLQVSVARDGSRGLLRHRSHAVQPVPRCPITHSLLEQAGAWRDRDRTARSGGGGRQAQKRISYAASASTGDVVIDGSGVLTHEALDHTFRVSAGGFWQVHPAAPELLSAAVLEATAPQPGESALDLYAGAGLFAYALADRGAAVIAVEQGEQAADDARFNCGEGVDVRTADVAEIIGELPASDVVVLDPPRTGAGPDVMRAITELRSRVIAYVSCDAATLARDLRAAVEAGYRVDRVRAFDLFPMTAHVELLAVLRPA